MQEWEWEQDHLQVVALGEQEKEMVVSQEVLPLAQLSPLVEVREMELEWAQQVEQGLGDCSH